MSVNCIEMVAVKTALLIRDDYGLQYLFIIPAIVIMLSAIYAAIFMPETHGLSLKQIGLLYLPEEVINKHTKILYF